MVPALGRRLVVLGGRQGVASRLRPQHGRDVGSFMSLALKSSADYHCSCGLSSAVCFSVHIAVPDRFALLVRGEPRLASEFHSLGLEENLILLHTACSGSTRGADPAAIRDVNWPAAHRHWYVKERIMSRFGLQP